VSAYDDNPSGIVNAAFIADSFPLTYDTATTNCPDSWLSSTFNELTKSFAYFLAPLIVDAELKSEASPII
jgi:hypothetical protein